jgi:hypothetical protein
MQVLAALFDSMASAGIAQLDVPVGSEQQEGPSAKRQRRSSGHEPAAAGTQRMRLETPFKAYTRGTVTSFLQMIYDSSAVCTVVHNNIVAGESNEVGITGLAACLPASQPASQPLAARQAWQSSHRWPVAML